MSNADMSFADALALVAVDPERAAQTILARVNEARAAHAQPAVDLPWLLAQIGRVLTQYHQHNQALGATTSVTDQAHGALAFLVLGWSRIFVGTGLSPEQEWRHLVGDAPVSDQRH